MSPRLRHLSVPCPQKLMHLAADQAQGGLWAALNCTHVSGIKSFAARGTIRAHDGTGLTASAASSPAADKA